MKFLKSFFLAFSGICVMFASAVMTINSTEAPEAQVRPLSKASVSAEHRDLKGPIKMDSEGYTNIALFGVDSRSRNLGRGTRTDSIIVASINNRTKEVRLVSVYRDTLLNIGKQGLQKCNAAYAYGGPEQAVKMLEKNLDLSISRYITVDFRCLVKMIDSVGGIKMTISDKEADAMRPFIEETGRVAGVDSKALKKGGTYQMDGVQAVTYARIRKLDGGDFARAERQRKVLSLLSERLKDCNILQLAGIIKDCLPYVKTDFTMDEIVRYASAYQEYSFQDTAGFPFEKTTDTVNGLGSIVIPMDLSSNVEELHSFLYPEVSYTLPDSVKDISNAVSSRVGR